MDHAGFGPRDGAVGVVSLALQALLLSYFGHYNATYGTHRRHHRVLMRGSTSRGSRIWLGAEMNAEIEHASPYGKDPGERVPERRRWSARRPQRPLRREAREGRDPDAPAPRGRQLRSRSAPPGAEHGVRPSDLIIGAIAARTGGGRRSGKVRPRPEDGRKRAGVRAQLLSGEARTIAASQASGRSLPPNAPVHRRRASTHGPAPATSPSPVALVGHEASWTTVGCERAWRAIRAR